MKFVFDSISENDTAPFRVCKVLSIKIQYTHFIHYYVSVRKNNLPNMSELPITWRYSPLYLTCFVVL